MRNVLGVAQRRYTVERVLGRGTTTLVELARDEAGRPFALKRLVLTGSGAELERARRRIRREAEILGRLRHPAIVPLLAVEDDGVDVVLVMPFVEGGSLRDRVWSAGPLPVDEVRRLAGPLLDGLAAVHRHGVVHRDISPANVLFDGEGRPVLADFGVAGARHHTIGVTGEGWTIGTPGFMAPEQARGEAATAATDVFGLAATLAFALTGRGPYGAGSPELLAWRAARGDLEPLPPDLPADLSVALAAMLDPDPPRRPTAAAVRGGPTGTLPDGAQVRAEPPRRRGRFVAKLAASAAAALVAVVVAVVALAGSGQRGAARTTASRPVPTTAPPCAPRPYQPCGQPMPAPFTDGRTCIDGHGDYDGVAANGCEAAPDQVAGHTLADKVALVANIVPADEVDSYPTYVRDTFQFFCDGELAVRLTAPRGVADRVEILRQGGRTVLASAVSTDGTPAVARLADPSCAHDDSGWYTVRVSGVAGRSAAAYRLERDGHF